MRIAIGWSRPRGSAVQYCVKVSAAALLDSYLLSLGGSTYAVIRPSARR